MNTKTSSTSTTQHSSITNSNTLFANNNYHKSMPIQPCYIPYSNYQIPYSLSQRGSLPIQPMLANVSMNYYNPQISINYPMNNCVNMNKIEKNPKTNLTVDEFTSLEELLLSLKGGKQLGNYIKSRNNSTSMINLIKKLSSEKLGELIEMIKPKLKDIMISNNKFSQKLFEQCTAEQRVIILNTIKDNFIEIALNKWGSFSLQALIKIVSLPEEQEIIKKCIEGKVYALAMDKQGNFVMQKLIMLLNEKGMTSINNEIFEVFNHLIYNSTGIGLLKNLILTNKGSDTRKKFVQKVIENLPNIINNQIGHSLLLYLMEKWDFETCKNMITEIIKDIQKYTSMRYSGQVVIRLINISDSKTVKCIYSTLFRTESIFQIIKTDFGKGIMIEIFKKLSKKQQMEAYSILDSTLSLKQNKDGNSSALMPEFIQALIE